MGGCAVSLQSLYPTQVLAPCSRAEFSNLFLVAFMLSKVKLPSPWARKGDVLSLENLRDLQAQHQSGTSSSFPTPHLHHWCPLCHLHLQPSGCQQGVGISETLKKVWEPLPRTKTTMEGKFWGQHHRSLHAFAGSVSYGVGDHAVPFTLPVGHFTE